MSTPRFPIRQVGFRSGLAWLPASAEWMRRGFRPLLAIAGLWLGVSMVALLPLVGQAILALITPLLSAGVMLAFDRLGERQLPPPATLFSAWNDPLRRSRLLMLGVFGMFGGLAAAVVLVTWLSNQIGADRLEAAVQSPEAMAEALAGASLGGGLLLSGAVMLLVLAALYFAVPLVMFGRAQVIPALSASLRAVVSNWAAFAGFALAAFGVVFGLFIIVLLVSSVLTLALGTPGGFLVQLIILVTVMLFQVLMTGAQYLAFSQIFGWSPGLEQDQRDDGTDLTL
ncbi:MAG: BPSS1780 family membrane protein [Wenzhouxiangella sp.]